MKNFNLLLSWAFLVLPFNLFAKQNAKWYGTELVSSFAEPCPTILMTASPSSQAVYIGSSTTAIEFSSETPGVTYSWTNNNPTIGLVSSGSGSSIPAFTTIGVGTAIITVIPSVGECSGTPFTVTITVNGCPNIVTSATPLIQGVPLGGHTQEIIISSNVPGVTFTWTNSNPSIGLAASGSGSSIPSFTVTGTGVASITITPVFENCTGAIFIATIYNNGTICPPVLMTASPAAQSVNPGQTTSEIVFSSALPGVIFKWTNDNPSIGLAESGTGNIPSFTTSLVNGVAIITVTPFTADGCSGIPIQTTISVSIALPVFLSTFAAKV